MSSRTSRRRDLLARSTITRLGWSIASGSPGISEVARPRNRPSRSRSARSQDSMARTATRKHICGAGSGSHDAMNGGTHSASLLRSTSTSHAEKRAARLYPGRDFLRWSFPFFPYTALKLAPASPTSRRSTTSSTKPSTAPEITTELAASTAQFPNSVSCCAFAGRVRGSRASAREIPPASSSLISVK